MKHITIKAVILLAIASNATAGSLSRTTKSTTTLRAPQNAQESQENMAAEKAAINESRKRSCGSCKPKECVVRKKKSCHSCKPKIERPKKECHTCNKCHRPVEPKAKKCGSCKHPVAQEVNQIDDNIDEETAVIVDGAAA